MISDCETGNPPEGWESEGQLRIADLGKGREVNQPVIPSPLGERVRVRGKVMGIHPHLNPPPQGGGGIF